jgi:plastocyanin
MQTGSDHVAYVKDVRRAAATAVLLAAVALVLGGANGAAAPAQSPTLFGEVGPDFEISLHDAQGNRVTKLDPGTYVIEVEDKSDFHTFHLEGPGVDERTEVTFTGKVTWTVTFRDGRYVYHCDPHPSLSGAFVVGNPTATPPPPPPGLVTSKTRLVVTAGPAEVITLKTAAGKAVKRLKRGTYTITIRDRSRLHNVRLRAPGYQRATTLNFVGTQRWKVKLTKLGTLRYSCDPHASTGMRGSAKIVA